MGPPKRKAPSRRPVLDLDGRDDSPSRPSWQSKYINSADGNVQNGDSQCGSSEITSSTASKSKPNPLSGLLGSYNSDSDSDTAESNNLNSKVEDFFKEIQLITPADTAETNVVRAGPSNPGVVKIDTNVVKGEPLKPSASEPSGSAPANYWQQCFDQSSGYSYFWNTQTNEVTWETPPGVKGSVNNGALKTDVTGRKATVGGKLPVIEPVVVKPKKKYPWEDSDSEDERIEMITSFGPQSGEESDGEPSQGTKGSKKGNSVHKSSIGPCLPKQPAGFVMEAEPLQSYETSPLLTHFVQDRGPPGDESYTKDAVSSSEPVTNPAAPPSRPLTPDSSAKEEPEPSLNVTEEPRPEVAKTPERLSENDNSSDASGDEKESILSKIKMKAKLLERIGGEVPVDVKNMLQSIESNVDSPSTSSAEVFENNTKEEVGSNESTDMETQAEVSTAERTDLDNKPSSFALIASYGADSDPEDSIEKPTTPVNKPLFPIAAFKPEPSNSKPLFPCVEEPIMAPQQALLQDLSLPDSTTMHKAFKRKKRIEVDLYAPSTSKASTSSIPDGPAEYNIDPSTSEHRGLGFSIAGADRPKPHKSVGISFIKAETLNAADQVPMLLPEQQTDSNTQSAQEKGKDASDEDLDDSVALLKEKVAFLSEADKAVTAMQQMAIQLETLVAAWQHGALTAAYLSRWLHTTHSCLVDHEKSASPSGWTCAWDRRNKRYFYRNTVTNVVQWEYPGAEAEQAGRAERQGCDEGGGEEMELCDTPPHTSPAHPGSPPATPPPPIISVISESSSMPQPPPPPQITPTCRRDGSKGKKKHKAEEVSSSSEGDVTVKSSEVCSSTPPLPPMPPPPPPPDEPPPPPPTPPPPLDPDQPLPPGVDDTEYSMLRRPSSKQVKAPDSSTYPPEVLMQFANYGMVSSSSHVPLFHGYDPGYLAPQPVKKPKLSLNSELDSFYSDIAMLDQPSTDTPSTSENIPLPKPPPEPAPAPAPPPPPAVLPKPAIASTSHSQVSSNDVKKRKKTKLAPGLSMKKKGVSSLVAKWQQVQEEVRRDLDSDSDDGDVSSTHK